ncbi:hypothetical protein B0H16DRAFT_1800990 [Mycena metata]|uniref:Uncharacterized protein n=1 Tax=Mycena metata TaxID=1033252 RepID=A0AAD7MH20_9AGAR|nr:hypothetical protein B0H16DRAFT_1800990 [Mycena metata]
MLAADILASYGSLARFRDIHHGILDEITTEFAARDGHTLNPAEVHNYLSELMPGNGGWVVPVCSLYFSFVGADSWCSLIAGHCGMTYSVSTLATGYGTHTVQPLLHHAVEGREDTLEEDEARKIIEQISTSTTPITAAGVNISEWHKLEASWGFAEGVWGTGADTVVKIQANELR